MALIDKDYFVPLGVLKIFQSVFGLITMSLISSGRMVKHTVELYFKRIRTVRPEVRRWGFIDTDYYWALIFCLLVTVILLVVTIVLFLSFLFKLYDKILLKHTWRIIDFLFNCLATLLYFILFILLAIYCANPKQERVTNNGSLVGACVISLFITGLYAFSAYKLGRAELQRVSETPPPIIKT